MYFFSFHRCFKFLNSAEFYYCQFEDVQIDNMIVKMPLEWWPRFITAIVIPTRDYDVCHGSIFFFTWHRSKTFLESLHTLLCILVLHKLCSRIGNVWIPRAKTLTTLPYYVVAACWARVWRDVIAMKVGYFRRNAKDALQVENQVLKSIVGMVSLRQVSTIILTENFIRIGHFKFHSWYLVAKVTKKKISYKRLGLNCNCQMFYCDPSIITYIITNISSRLNKKRYWTHFVQNFWYAQNNKFYVNFDIRGY